MKLIWESRKMLKNRWSKSLAREASTAPPACLLVKSGECILKALTLPCTWKQEVDERGQGRDTVRGALPDDLGFAVESQVIWYFLQGSPGNQPARGQAQMDWRGFGGPGGGGVCWSLRLSRDYTRKNSNVIRHRRDRLALKKGMEKEGGRVTEKGGDNQKGERRNKV